MAEKIEVWRGISCWVAPDGTVYETDCAKHERKAREILENISGKKWLDIEDVSSPADLLLDMGFLRVSVGVPYFEFFKQGTYYSRPLTSKQTDFLGELSNVTKESDKFQKLAEIFHLQAEAIGEKIGDKLSSELQYDREYARKRKKLNYEYDGKTLTIL